MVLTSGYSNFQTVTIVTIVTINCDNCENCEDFSPHKSLLRQLLVEVFPLDKKITVGQNKENIPTIHSIFPFNSAHC